MPEPRGQPVHEGESQPVASDFDSALADAVRLLEYAASTGLWSAREPGAERLIGDIINAQEAAQARAVTPQVAIAFWLSYGRLANLLKPVTALSLTTSRRISLMAMKVQATLLVAVIIVFSIFLFMSTTTLSDASDLIERQNAAALKLWSDTQMLQTGRRGETAAPVPATGEAPVLMADRVFEETVEFSRNNVLLLQSASRLNYWFTLPWMRLSTEDVTFNSTNPNGMNHVNVPPELPTVSQIVAEAFYQIKAYQYIRDYALGLYKINTLIYSSLATYFLPTVYALLGAFLYGFRFYSRLIRRCEFLPSAAHSARYFIAAIAGLVLGLFGSLLPKSLMLPPLAVAFLVGYAVEAFFSRLDGLIRKLKGDNGLVAVSASGEAEASLPAE